MRLSTFNPWMHGLAAWGLCFYTAVSQACSCMSLDPQESFETNALIFRGTAEFVDQKAGRVRFKVHTVYKGVIDGTSFEMKYWNLSGSACGTSFSVGKTETMVTGYAGNDIDKLEFTSSLCSRFSVTESLSALQPILDSYQRQLRNAKLEIARHQNSPEAWAVLAKIQESSRDYMALLSTFRKIRELEPQVASHAARHGDALAALTRREEALTAYNVALKLDSGNAQAKRGRDQVLIKMGRATDVDVNRREFSDMELPNADFSGRDLTGARFVKSNLIQPKFSQAHLSNAEFSEANFRHGSFVGADLRASRFTGIRAYKVDFSGANLTGANFAKTNLQDGRFDGAQLSNADFSGATLEHASFVKTKLSSTKFVGTKLYGADFSGADLSGMDLTGLEMQGVSLYGAKLMRANLTGAYLAGPIKPYRDDEALHGPGNSTDLRGANLSEAKLANADIRYALFDCQTIWPKGFDPASLMLIPITSKACSGPPLKTKLFERPGVLREMRGRFGNDRSKVRGPNLEKRDLAGVNLSNANLSGFSLWTSNFQDAMLRDTDLRNSSIQGSDFRGADLRGADLSGSLVLASNFSTASLAGAKLTGVSYDVGTQWPPGFDPQKAGAVLQPQR